LCAAVAWGGGRTRISQAFKEHFINILVQEPRSEAVNELRFGHHFRFGHRENKKMVEQKIGSKRKKQPQERSLPPETRCQKKRCTFSDVVRGKITQKGNCDANPMTENPKVMTETEK
jgi:hypothetical protein